LVASTKGIVTKCWIPHVFGSVIKGNSHEMLATSCVW